MEDRELPGAYHRIRFALTATDGSESTHDDGGESAGVDIETTRPELLAACVALVAHPDDDRYRVTGRHTMCVTPLFEVRVPVLAHPLADPEKGSGIAMICTFGDTTDVTWWRELACRTRTIVGRNGRLRAVAWGEPGWESEQPDAAARAYGELAGNATSPRPGRASSSCSPRPGRSSVSPSPITHPVKFYERGDRPLEIVSSRQWYVRTLACATACSSGAASCAGTRRTCGTATRRGSRG